MGSKLFVLYTVLHILTLFIFCIESQNITCIGKQSCKEHTITCNYGQSCTLNCDGGSQDGQACEKVNFDASQASDVIVYCKGKQDCIDMKITCGTGDCDIECHGEQSCKSTELICGDGSCIIDCQISDSCEQIDINIADATSFNCDASNSDYCPDNYSPFILTTNAPTTTSTTPSPITTSSHPTTSSPTTSFPTTYLPSTASPTTQYPTSTSPTTYSPTSKSPTTAEPTTFPTSDPTKHPTFHPTSKPTENPIIEMISSTETPTQSISTTMMPTTNSIPITSETAEYSTTNILYGVHLYLSFVFQKNQSDTSNDTLSTTSQIIKFILNDEINSNSICTTSEYHIDSSFLEQTTISSNGTIPTCQQQDQSILMKELHTNFNQQFINISSERGLFDIIHINSSFAPIILGTYPGYQPNSNISNTTKSNLITDRNKNQNTNNNKATMIIIYFFAADFAFLLVLICLYKTYKFYDEYKYNQKLLEQESEWILEMEEKNNNYNHTTNKTTTTPGGNFNCNTTTTGNTLNTNSLRINTNTPCTTLTNRYTEGEEDDLTIPRLTNNATNNTEKDFNTLENIFNDVIDYGDNNKNNPKEMEMVKTSSLRVDPSTPILIYTPENPEGENNLDICYENIKL